MSKLKHIVLAIVMNLGSLLWLFAQSYDAQWIQSPVTTTIMDFRNDTIQFRYLNNSSTAFMATANICNKDGDFLFYTNGINVRNRLGDIMSNGDSLSFYNPNYYSSITWGAPNDQGVIILPKPGSNNLYYIFHFVPTDTNFIFQGISYNLPTHFYYSVVDMNANFGLGDVVQKNVRLPLAGVNCASRLTAVKHANGRDWWIIRHGWSDNKYIKFLLTPDTILGPYFQNIGPAFNQNGRAYDFYGASVFNLQGTQLATANFLGPTVVLDFDRCSGEFSNPLIINNKWSDTTLLGAMGLSFSPSGRFLYVNALFILNQYDLQSLIPNDSVALYVVDSTDGAFLHQQRLGPNGKIYISTWHGGTSHLHVINKPDELGLACDFEFQGQECITSNTSNLPNMVNYKLGALVGSGCDTITTEIRDKGEGRGEREIQLSPNLGSNELNFAIKETLLGAQLNIYNATGALVQSTQLSTRKLQLATGNFASGVYLAIIKTKNNEQHSVRFVVQH